jgi:hypothetical protein
MRLTVKSLPQRAESANGKIYDVGVKDRLAVLNPCQRAWADLPGQGRSR